MTLPDIIQLPPHELLQSTATPFGSSRYAERQRCTEAYDLKYNRRILPIYRPSYFGIGSLVHAGIRQAEQGAALGLELDWREPINFARECAERTAKEREAAGDELPPAAGFGIDEVDEAERLLAAYFARWGESNGGWPSYLEVVALELQLATTSMGEELTGAIDTLLLNRDSGQLIIVDTKTAAQRVSLDEDKRTKWKRGMAVRPQFLMLSWMLREKLQLPFDEPPALWVNHISKAKIPVCERIPLNITAEALAAWESNQRKLAEVAAMHIVPTRNYSACAPPMGDQCAYFDFCHGSDIARGKLYEQKKDE